ncbi:response regulator transcription factor [Poseidonibacter ostreae]|jgi:DNA-binding response OmpR family regulator|uniref:Response regulator n=1 Tax=Poseidonibacter ostreae TaxID=2654171 RepID=A0ABQ6VQH5_9BACT|nr:response regulator transcription factor [Poseidonibacter ostreae]KAB7885745.1 response regulator [Poseidonibacter ostreae]KAB7893026.1 response regulator [Poseidonibacter ostreae]MAC85011.1 DNA-binding response regulator [Arcobacter sp.]|tara:strand:+ start:5388 stop:6047 length:660 start_codon:yes stop_codon:yes gene_type:complete
MRVLLLEDDNLLSDLLNDHLIDKGYDVTLCLNGQDALEYLIDEKFDLALLDINTPIISGLEVLKTIREEYKNKTPVIILTAYQDTKHLKDSFENGVDDYIKKPFDLEELDQRILRLCRQFSIEQNSNIEISTDILFDPESCKISLKDKNVSIAQKERDILKYFCTHRNRVISSEELLQNIWAYEEMPTDATIRVYIKNLREIIGKEKITTIRGIGYKFE